MLSAKEARQRAVNKLDEVDTFTLTAIKAEIEKASGAGNTHTVWPGLMSKKIKVVLEEHGYEVKTGSQYNEDYYIIAW